VWLQVEQQMCSAVAFVVVVVVTAVGRQLFVLVEVVGIFLVQPGPLHVAVCLPFFYSCIWEFNEADIQSAGC